MSASGAMASVKFNRAQLKKRKPLDRKNYIGKGKTQLNFTKTSMEGRKRIQQKIDAHQTALKRNKIIALITVIMLLVMRFVLVSYF